MKEMKVIIAGPRGRMGHEAVSSYGKNGTF